MNYKVVTRSKLMFSILFLISTGLFSQKIFTRSGGNNTWEDPDNWSPIGVPTASDDVVISGFSVTVNSNRVANKVTLNAGSSGTSLTIQTNTLTIEELEVNQNTADVRHMDVIVQNDAVLNVTGDINFIRSALHTSNRRMRMYLSSTSEVNVDGDFTITSNGGVNEVNPELFMEDDSKLTVAGDLNLNSNSSDSDLRVYLIDNSVLTVNNNLNSTFTGATFNNNSDLFLFLEGDASLNIEKSVSIDKNGGDNIIFRVLETSNILIKENFTLNQQYGSSFDFIADGTTTDITVLGDVLLNHNGDGGFATEDFDFDINSGSASFGSTTINSNSSPSDRFRFLIRPTGSDLIFEDLNVNFYEGKNFILYVNQDSQADEASLTINGDLNVDFDNGNNMDWDFYDNATSNITGNININIGTDDLDDFEWTIRDHDVTFNDFKYTSSGASSVAASGDFDLNIYGSDFTVDDFIVEHNAMHDFRIYLDNNTSYSGSTLSISDSLKITKGNLSNDIQIVNSGNGINSKISIGTIDVDFTGDTGQDFFLRNLSEGDSIVVANDINIRATGVDDTDNDVQILSENGAVLIGGDLKIATTDMADISVNINYTEFYVGGDLIMSESNEARNSNLILDGGLGTIQGDVIMTGSYTNNQRVRVRESGFLTLEQDLIVNLNGGDDFLIELGTNGSSKGVLEIKGDAIFDRSSDAVDIGWNLYDGSKLTVEEDVIFTTEGGGSDRINLFWDNDQDTVLVGGDFSATNISVSTTEDDFNLDKNSGVFIVDGDFTVIQNGGDDIFIDMTSDAGYTTIGGDVFLDIDNADDVQFFMSGDSTRIKGSLTIDADNSSFVDVNTRKGIVNISGEVLLQNNISNSHTDWDQDAGIVTIGKGIRFDVDEALEARIYLDSNTVLNITDSLIFDLGANAGAARLRMNVSSGSGSIVNVKDIQIKQKGGSLAELYLNNDALLNVTNNLDVDFVADGGDYFEILTRNADTILVGNDILVDFTGNNNDASDFIIDNLGTQSYINVGRDIVANMNSSGELILDLEGSKTDIGRYLTLNADDARGTDWDIDDAILNIVDDITINVLNYNASIRSISDNNMNIDGVSDLNFNQDFILNYNSSMIRATRLYINGQSSVSIADSLFFDLDLNSGSTNLLINDNGGAGSELLVGGSLIYDHESDAGDIFIRTNGEDSKIQIEKDFIASHDASGGDFIELELNGLNDTLIIKGDLLWEMSSGSDNGTDDLIIDINDELFFDIGGNVSLTARDAGGLIFVNDGGDVNIHGYLEMIDTSSTERSLQLNSGTIDVDEDVRIYGDQSSGLSQILLNGGVATFSQDVLITTSNNVNASARVDVNAGIINVLNDLIITSDNGRDADINVQVGELNVGDDFHLICPICENVDIRLDLGGQVFIADSFYVDIDESRGNSVFYFNNSDDNLPVKFSVGNDIVIDHEEAGQNINFQQFGNSTIEVGDDIIANFHAVADGLSFILGKATDSLFVGGEMNLTAPTGSYSSLGTYNTADDITLDINGGYVDIVEDLTIAMFGASNPRLLIDSGDVNIGGQLLLTADNAGGANFQMYDGSLDVAGDKKILITNGISGFGSEWRFFGGISNFMEDVIIQIEGNITSMNGAIASDAVVNISDSLIFDDEMTGAFNLIFDTPTGNGPELNVGSTFFVNHELAGADMNISLNGNAKLNVVDDIVVNHAAEGNDFFYLQSQNASDTLLIGDDIRLNMTAGLASENENDIRFYVTEGFVDIGDSIIYTATAGADMELSLSGGEVNVGSSVSMIGDGHDDTYLLLNGGTFNVAKDFIATSSNHDDFVFDFNGGTFNVSRDVMINNLSGDVMNIDIDGGSTWDIVEDMTIRQAGSGRLTLSLDGNSSITTGDSLIYHTINAFDNYIYLEDGAGTGSSITVGSDLILDHEASSGDFRIRLEGDSKIEVVDDLLIDQKLDGVTGDFFLFELDEKGGNDTLLIGGDFLLTSTGAAGSTNQDYTTLQMNGGYIGVTGELNMQATKLGTTSSLNMDINGGHLEIGESLTLSGSNGCDDVRYDLDGGQADITGKVLIQNIDGDQAEFSHQGVDGRYMETVDVYTNNSVTNGAYMIVGGSGTVVFEDTVTVAAVDGGNVEIESNGTGSLTFLENVYLLDTNSNDQRLDFNGSTIELQKDLIVYNEGGDEFDLDVDGGDFTIGDDFIITTLNTTNSTDFRLDGVSSLTVTDSMIVNVTNNGNSFVLLYLDDGGSTGAELNVGTLQMNRGADVGDTRVLLEGDANLIIQKDMDINHTTVAGGDYFEIQLTAGNNDTLMIGGDLLIDHIGDDNVNGNVIIDVLDGYMEVANDMIVNLDGRGDITFDTRNDAQFLVSDSVVLNMISGDDIDIDFDATSMITFGSFDINKALESDEVRMVISDDVVWTIDNTMHWDHNASERDLGRLQFASGNPIMNVGDMMVDININNTSTNGNNNFFLDLNAGTLNVTNDLYLNFIEGRDVFFTLDGASTVTVGGDLHADKDSGRDFYIDLGSTSGNNLLQVEGDLNMDALDDSGDNIELEINNTSIVDVNGDLQFNTTTDGQLEVDINGSSDLQIAGAIDRAINGNEYGEILCDATAMVTYDGSSAQIMEEEAGGGSDLISYGIVRINNTSGLLPAVTLEDNLGGSASVTGMNYQEGQLYLNKQTLTVTNGVSTAVTRTNGSVRSEDTDNSSVLKWQVDSNTGSHLFPFSSNTGQYLPLTMNLTSGNAGDIDIATYPTGSDNLPFSPGVTNMNRDGYIDNTLNVADRHWQIDVSGTPTIDMTIPYLETEIAAPNTMTEAELQAQRWDGSNWEYPVGIVNTSNNTVTVSGVTTFSPWVLSNSTTPLPINLVGVSLEEEEGIATVYWSTAQEINNDYFEVLISLDGINFELAGTEQGAGNSSKLIEYSYGFGELSNGTYYVKIRQIDFDGTSTESNIESMTITNNNSQSLGLYPNLINSGDLINITYDLALSENVNINIYDEKGTVLKAYNQDVEQGSGVIQVNPTMLVSGAYIVEVICTQETKKFKLIVY